MEAFKPFDVVDATFMPLDRDRILPDATPWIGHRATWEAIWIVDPGSYRSRIVFSLRHDQTQPDEHPPFTWVPIYDLEIHGKIAAVHA